MRSLPATPRARARTALGLAAALTASLVGTGTSLAHASTPAPAWTITVVSGPTNFTPGQHTGEDNYLVIATNSGGAPTTAGTITLTDNLPAGMTLDSAPANGNNEFRIRDNAGNEEGLECGAGPTVTCTDSQKEYPVRPGESVWITVPVDVAQNASASSINEVSVTGGGAPSASATNSTAINATPAGVGFEAGHQGFDGAVLGADGSPVSQAGSHPYQTTLSFALNNSIQHFHDAAAGEPKTITANLPPGVIVDPNATPTKCTEAQLETDFGQGGCPDSSAVGTVRIVYGLLGFPTTETEPVFNMVAPPGTPANLGFDALASGIYVHLRGFVRTGGDYGLSATANDILQKGSTFGFSATLWGNPSDPSHDVLRGHCFGGGSQPPRFCPVTPTNTALLTLPTKCSGPLTTTIEAESWQEPGKLVTDEFASHDNEGQPLGVGGCSKLDFSPSITVRPDTTVADGPSGLRVDLHVPQNEAYTGLAEANLKSAVVTLPPGQVVNPAAANGLQACSPAQIGLSGSGPARCPDGSKIGSVEVDTPLLDHALPGGVYLATQTDNPFGSLLAIYVVVDDPQTGVVVKLAGHVEADPATGQLTTTFDNNPQLPFTDFKLRFFGGPRAPLVTPSACGTYETTSSLSPWSGTPAASPSDTFAINAGCGGGFSPSFAAGTTNNQAGGYSPFSVTLSRGDGEQRLGVVQMKAPPGLLGAVKTVAQCPEPQASQGTCGPASLIGHTTDGAGAGTDPFFVGGSVFLTGPYKGAAFGLSIVVPAIAGPFNLGDVIVRARIEIDPHTSQITVTSDPLPTILQGIPLDIRTVNVTVDRPGFMLNPTNCSPLSVTGAVISTTGTSAAVSSPFEATNCATLAFKPKFTVLTLAKTSKANGAALRVKVASGPGQANIAKVRVALPRQLPSRLTTLQKACVDSVFNANPAACPPGSVVGVATAATPLLTQQLQGPAILVSHAAAAFPDLVIVLQGEGITLDLVGNTDIKRGVTTSTFNSVPDAPVSTFDLVLPEGPHSALGAVESLCAKPLTMPTTITAQNGAVIKQATRIAVSGCPKHKRAKRATKRHRRK